MNPPMKPPPTPEPKQAATWALEVVRGAEPGRRFALARGVVVLGRGPLDRGSIDLAAQEGSTLRPMEARHASVESTDLGPVVRDLESPGGTFVNRRRLLPGQGVALHPGDLIQLASVQLRLVAGSGPAAVMPASPHRPAVVPAGPFAYRLADGATVRTWDDFLALSAQRWAAIRDELTSGRIAAFLPTIGRGDLVPRPSPGLSDDERLDAWLGSLPTTRASGPEIDVHPARLVVRATPGGGTLRRVVQVSNVGHRLLRSTARVEPPGQAWLRLAPETPAGPFVTVEATDLAIELAIPATLPAPLRAELVIEGNGGTRRVAVVLEARPAAVDPLEAAGDGDPAAGDDPALIAWIANRPIPARLAAAALGALVIRLLVGVAGGSIGEDGMTPAGPDSPGLLRVGLAFAILGGGLAAWLARRRGGLGEVPTGAFAGACGSLVVASALVATCRGIEPLLGGWSGSIGAACLLWAALGASLALVSAVLIPKEPS